MPQSCVPADADTDNEMHYGDGHLMKLIVVMTHWEHHDVHAMM